MNIGLPEREVFIDDPDTEPVSEPVSVPEREREPVGVPA